MSKELFDTGLVPLVLFVLCFLSYGLLTPWLGYYFDDWFFLWISLSSGPSGLREAISDERPFLGWLWTITTSVLGKEPLQWHILALVNRWLGAVALWWCLRGVWPKRRQEVVCVALLFAMYPGFTQQPIAWISQGLFIPLVLFLFSLGAMVWALRAPRFFWLLNLVALLCSGISVLFVEYYVGLELLRPVFLWTVLSEKISDVRQRLKRTLLNWTPYLAVVGVFTIWRLFIFHTSREGTDPSKVFAAFKANPISELAWRFYFAFTDLVETSLMAWTQTFRPDVFDGNSHFVLAAAWGLSFVTVLMIVFYLRRLSPTSAAPVSNESDTEYLWARKAVFIGLFAILVGQLPIWFSARQVKLESLHDRFALPAILGACLLLVGLIKLLIKTRLQQIIVTSIIIGLAVGFHFRNANRYRRDWTTQKSLFWQLSWRVPGLKPGTAILVGEKSSPVATDYALAAPLNLLYAPQNSSVRPDYWVFNLSNQLGESVPSLASDEVLKRTLRTVSFTGNTSDSLVIWQSPAGCLRIVDASRDEIPQISMWTRAARHLSSLDRIVINPQNPARPPAEIFGPEPKLSWCYYFQKADLARQTGDWEKVVRIGDEARSIGLSPNDAVEWIPFIEGYAKVGRIDDAKERANLALKAKEGPMSLSTFICRYDDSVRESAYKTFIGEMRRRLSCPG